MLRVWERRLALEVDARQPDGTVRMQERGALERTAPSLCHETTESNQDRVAHVMRYVNSNGRLSTLAPEGPSGTRAAATPGTLQHLDAWAAPERATRALGELVAADEAQPFAPLVRAASGRIRREPL